MDAKIVPDIGQDVKKEELDTLSEWVKIVWSLIRIKKKTSIAPWGPAEKAPNNIVLCVNHIIYTAR
jgi:hypothetical protein